MANNFYLNDPLLFQTPYSRGMESEEDIKRQFTDFMTKYNSRQSQQQSRDYVGELEDAVKTITSTSSDSLSANEEYNDLRASLSEMIQYELMQTIRWKINSNASAFAKIFGVCFHAAFLPNNLSAILSTNSCTRHTLKSHIRRRL